MKTGDSVENVTVRTCPHRQGADFFYVANQPGEAPVILVSGLIGPTIISLTNQTVRMSCPVCFDEIRKAATQILSPDTLNRLVPQSN